MSREGDGERIDYPIGLSGLICIHNILVDWTPVRPPLHLPFSRSLSSFVGCIGFSLATRSQPSSTASRCALLLLLLHPRVSIRRASARSYLSLSFSFSSYLSRHDKVVSRLDPFGIRLLIISGGTVNQLP